MAVTSRSSISVYPPIFVILIQPAGERSKEKAERHDHISLTQYAQGSPCPASPPLKKTPAMIPNGTWASLKYRISVNHPADLLT